MLVVLQFPISDARPLDNESELRLALPDWPNPATTIAPQFVHNFGRAVERRRDADLAWPDEFKFCTARRALRFADLARQGAGLPGARFRPQCAFRRLLCDGQTVVRVEVGLAHDSDTGKLRGLGTHEILAIATDLCDLPTVVWQVGRSPSKDKLLRQGGALARLYTRSSLSREAIAKAELAQTLVEAGNPLLVIELEPFEAAFPLIPPGFTAVPSEKTLGANLAYGRLRTRGGTVGTWLLQRGISSKAQSRSLRICLMRLHAEQEALDLVLKQIKRKRLPVPATSELVDAFDDYFNTKTRLINRGEWGNIGQSAILSAFDAAEDVAPPASRLNLIERYDGARRQVWKKVEEYQLRRAAVRVVSVVNVDRGGTYVEKNVSINQSGTGNILNVADFMSNVTNQVNNNIQESTASDEAKNLVKQLTVEIEAISTKVDPKKIQQMGNDVQTLSGEMKQPEPRKAWYELSLKGLKEAAEAVGELAAPIVATVKKLIPLLLGS